MSVLGKKKYVSEETDDINHVTSQLNDCKINVNSNDAIIYLRVSTKSQSESLNVQEQVARNYCIKNKLNIKKVVKDIGSAYNNIYKLSINDIIENNSNINLVIASPSRLSRDIVHGAELINDCNKKNILTHVVDQNYICNSNVSNKKLLEGIFDAMIESKTLSERQISHNKIRKSKGYYFGVVPFGMVAYNTFINNISIRKLKDLPKSHEETKIIELIDMMYYGTSSKEFYTHFNSLQQYPDKLGGPKFKFTDYMKNEYTESDFNMGFTLGTIVGLFNDWRILKRGKMWNIDSLKGVIKNHIDSNIFPDKMEADSVQVKYETDSDSDIEV